MKILHVLTSNRFSGAENVVCQIIGMFKNEQDIEMAYCSPDGEIREALAERDIRFLPIKRLNKKELRTIICEYQPDIVHAHDMRASFVAAKTVGKIPMISHIHNNAFNSRSISLKSLAYLYAAKKAKHIFWVSESSYAGYTFHNRLAEKSTVLRNIIDINALQKKMLMDSQSYHYDIVYLGRLSYEKNPQRLVKVLKKVIDKCGNCKVGIIGTGDLENEVKLLTKELGIEKNIEFLGFKSNPLKILSNAKATVMTSRWEGTPMCALESMALGVPMVSTPTDGLKELITDGVNGFLSDDDQVLAERICVIIQDEKLHAKMSKAQIEKAEEINDINNYKQEVKKVYVNALGEEYNE